MSGRMTSCTLAYGAKTLRIGNLFCVLGALLWLLMLHGCAAATRPAVSARPAAHPHARLQPPPQDSDKDGVADACDECARTPAAVAVDSSGCPLSLYMHMRVPDSGRRFQDDSALLDRLQRLAAILHANPRARLLIEAHTDSADTPSVQQSASQQRADALAALLRSRWNVRPGQLLAAGYGSSRPLVSNATPQGRRRNKRLELLVQGYYRRGGQAGPRRPAAGAAQARLPEPLTLTFRSGSAASGKFTPKERRALGDLAQFIKAHPGVSLRIEGHTDNVGSARANQALSEQRARQTYKTLVTAYGIPGQRLSVRGFGEERPVADNTTPQGRSKNRRVRLVLHTGQDAPAAQIAYKPLVLPASPGQAAAAQKARTSRAEPSRIPKARLSRARSYEVMVSVNKRRLWLYELGAKGKKQLVRTYVVATPRPGKPVPWGSGEITRIEFNPWWYPTPNIKRDYFRRKGVRLPNSIPPGRKSNPMGKFKIHLSHGSGFRIHGTNAPSQIGRRVSSGCIRMRNAEGLEMAHALSVGTKVTVVR